MKFKDMQYNRPDINAICDQLEKASTEAATAQDSKQLINTFESYCDLSDSVSSLSSIASIRHTINTNDEFYAGENDYFDEQSPILGDKSLDFYRAVLSSEHKKALAEKYGQILLDKMQLDVKTSDERLITFQQTENALETQYDKLYAGAKIKFDGKELTLPQLGPYKQHLNRDLRRGAVEAEGIFFDSHREELDDIFDKMVKNRTEQAKLMGYDNFTPLGDLRMQRLGYTRADIAACRNAVVKDIVPLCKKLKEKQAGRLGLETLKFHDEALYFKEGNPTPKGNPEELLAAGQSMYRALSPETAEFMDFMMQNELFDVISRPGKAPGGYCTSIPSHKSPFIFSNFNTTAGDVDVLTHEAGHAFASFVAMRNNLPSLLRSPALESCEIHSMSMEFLTKEYYPLFFKQDAARYDEYHTADALLFLPYGCAVDEFQEIIYQNPGLSPAQRCDVWLELESKYRPWVDFDSLPFYSRGAGWQRQLHIYEAPFYYIDYVLAQSVALDFMRLHGQDKADAWQRYLALVGKAGTETYKGLVASAGLKTPFEKGTLAQVGAFAYKKIIG